MPTRRVREEKKIAPSLHSKKKGNSITEPLKSERYTEITLDWLCLINELLYREKAGKGYTNAAAEISKRLPCF